MNARALPRSPFVVERGFTLVEMVVIVLIVAILAAIAYPSYLAQVRKARRTDAIESLLYIQQLQEKYRVHHTEYGLLTQIGYPGATASEAFSAQGYYTLTVSDNTTTGYLATASATGVQTADAGCASITLAVSASHPRGQRQSTGGEMCW